MRTVGVTSSQTASSHFHLLIVCFIAALAPSALGFKYHDFCSNPPMDMKTRFPLYMLEVDTKLNGHPWAYRQNDTIKVSIKALYQQYKIKQVFISVPSMTRGTPERPARRIHLGKWAWDMKGGVVPLDCSSPKSGFGGGADAVRNLWWFPGGFYNITAEWDPLNTIYNAYNVDMVQFTAYVSPDKEVAALPPGVMGPMPQQARWVKLISNEFVNMDYIDLQRYMQKMYGTYLDPQLYGMGPGANSWSEMDG